MERALFIGRFQPFHLGHLKAVEYILRGADELVIAVGSAQYSHTLKNPFTAGERLTMIRLALLDAGVRMDRIQIIPVPDVHVHKVWVPHLVSLTPTFSVVYSNEPLTARLFEEEGYRVEAIPFFERELYSSTEIRKRILEGGDWKMLVPKAVAEFIEEIHGVERIRDLARSDRVSSHGS